MGRQAHVPPILADGRRGTTASPLAPPAPTVSGGDDRSVAVELVEVHRRFGENPALAGLNLVVPAARITVLLGPNGAGKTTAIRMVTGALTPDHGSVRVFGLDPET